MRLRDRLATVTQKGACSRPIAASSISRTQSADAREIAKSKPLDRRDPRNEPVCTRLMPPTCGRAGPARCWREICERCGALMGRTPTHYRSSCAAVPPAPRLATIPCSRSLGERVSSVFRRHRGLSTGRAAAVAQRPNRKLRETASTLASPDKVPSRGRGTRRGRRRSARAGLCQEVLADGAAAIRGQGPTVGGYAFLPEVEAPPQGLREKLTG